MTDEQLNIQLYDSLCTSVQKWFEKDRGYEVEISMHINRDCRDICFPKVVIGDTERDATFSVLIGKEPLVDVCKPMRCHLGISIAFDDKILGAVESEKEDGGDVLKVINRFNMWNKDMCCVYDERFDTIEIHQDFYFYPGSLPSDEEIASILDEFYLNKDIVSIAELIESGGWRFPDLYVTNLFIKKVNLL